MKKQILIWGGVFIATFFALFLLVKYNSGPQAVDETTYPEVSIIGAKDQTKGDTASKIVLVEYGDFQCPACAVYEEFVTKLTDEFKNSIVFVYRNFPLRGHSNAVPAARYAEAAGLQGKYWEMHDILYARQQAWAGLADAEPTFQKYGEELQLDIVKLKIDAASDAVKQKIDKDTNGGFNFNVNATPTFFLNGQKIQPANYDEFKSLINTAIAK